MLNNEELDKQIALLEKEVAELREELVAKENILFNLATLAESLFG